MRLQESGEMYLETIYILSLRSGAVRSLDVAEYMNFSKPSVSRAVNLLKDHGYLDIDKGGKITLTEEGLAVADSIYERHRVLTDVLMHLGVRKKTAADDACRIEHVISPESFERVKEYFADITKDK